MEQCTAPPPCHMCPACLLEYWSTTVTYLTDCILHQELSPWKGISGYVMHPDTRARVPEVNDHFCRLLPEPYASDIPDGRSFRPSERRPPERPQDTRRGFCNLENTLQGHVKFSFSLLIHRLPEKQIYDIFSPFPLFPWCVWTLSTSPASDGVTSMEPVFTVPVTIDGQYTFSICLFPARKECFDFKNPPRLFFSFE